MSPPVTEVLDIGGQPAEVMVPANRNGYLVIHYHGHGENQTAMRTDTWNKWPITQDLLAAGYMVAGSAAQSNNWGNPASVADYEALYAYVNGRWGVTKVLHLSQSMGGLSGLNTIAHGVVPAHGWAGIFPACSLSSMFASNAGTYAASIRAAYGIASDGSDYSTKTSGSDPMTVSASLFTGVPMRFYASSSDTVATKADNSDAFSARVGSLTPEETVVACTGSHGNASHFQSSDLLAFFARCVT